MGISFGSINTGLPKDIVQKLVEAEKIPIKKMEQRRAKIENKQKLIRELTSLVSSLKENVTGNKDVRSLRELKVDTNNDIINVEIDKNEAIPGSYQMEVIDLAKKSTAITTGFEDKDNSYVGVGYIKYELPNGDNKEVYIDSGNSSLTSIANLLNKDPDMGLMATVINDGSGSSTPWRLNLSLKDGGDYNKAEFPSFYFIDGEEDLYLEHERKAKDATIRFNGYEMEVPTNKVKNLIPGAVIDLKKASPGDEFSINITEDSVAITEKVKDMTTRINDILKFIKKQNSITQYSDTSATLGGDFLLQSLESRIRNILFKDIQTSSGPKRLGDLGITFQKSGLLEFDDKQFNKMTAENFGVVAEVLVGRFDKEEEIRIPGAIEHLQKVVKSTLQTPSGLLYSRNNNLNSKIKQIDSRIAQKERMVAQKEKNLKAKFSRLESTIAKLKNQSSGLASLGVQANNPVQQLG